MARYRPQRRRLFGARPLVLYRPGMVGYTHVRGSTATYRDSTGVLQSSGANTPRDAHFVQNPVSGVFERTLLTEGQRSNAYPYSEELDQAAWSKTNCTITPNAGFAPNGTLTADKIVEDTTAGVSHTVSRSFGGATDNTLQSASVFLGPAGRNWAVLVTANKAGASGVSYFDLINGVWGTVAASHTVRATQYTLGFWRLSVTWDAATGGSATIFRVRPATGNGGTSYTGDGSSGIYAWGMQVEVDAPFSSTYIPTGAATATRAADAFTMPFAHVPQPGTLYTRMFDLGSYAVAGSRLVAVSSAVPRLLVFNASGAAGYRGQHENATTTSTSTLAAYPAFGQLAELRLTTATDGSARLGQSLNGGAESMAAAGGAASYAAAWNAASLYLGHAAGANAGFAAYTHFLVMAADRDRAQCRSVLGL